MDGQLRAKDREGYSLDWIVNHVRAGLFESMSDEEFTELKEGVIRDETHRRYFWREDFLKGKFADELLPLLEETWGHGVGVHIGQVPDPHDDWRILEARGPRQPQWHRVTWKYGFGGGHGAIAYPCAYDRNVRTYSVSRTKFRLPARDGTLCSSCATQTASNSIWVKLLT